MVGSGFRKSSELGPVYEIVRNRIQFLKEFGTGSGLRNSSEPDPVFEKVWNRIRILKKKMSNPDMVFGSYRVPDPDPVMKERFIITDPDPRFQVSC